MLIATFNVNSIRQRLPHLARWLKSREPDVVCLQELKCLDDAFPREEIEALGYQVETFGQKTFNGVAILSRHGVAIEHRGLPGFPDEQARYIEGVVSLPPGHRLGAVLRIAGVYFPNGNPVGSPKFEYKRAFMAALTAHAESLLALEEPLIIAAVWSLSASRMPSARRVTIPASIRSGIIRPGPGSAITASASITCCSRRARRTG